MAKPGTPTVATPAPAKPRKARPAVDKDVRKRANLLKEISQLYKDAAESLTSGDEAKAYAQLEIVDKYAELFEALSQSAAEDETVEELVKAQEM